MREELLKYSELNGPRWELSAAAENSFGTQPLLDDAYQRVLEERKSDESLSVLSLQVLCARADDEIRTTALAALTSGDPARRQLGAMILREFGDAHLRETRPQALEFVEALIPAIEKEDDDEVLSWLLAALTWQKHQAAIPTLLTFLDDHRPWARTRIADWLVALNGDEHTPLRPSLAAAALKLVSDPDDDVRWAICYEIALWPRVFSPIADSLQAILGDSTESDDKVAEQRMRALIALEDPDNVPETLP